MSACLFQGTVFFDNLLQKLQMSYQFTLEDYMDGMAIRSKPLRKMVNGLPFQDMLPLSHKSSVPALMKYLS